MSLKAINISEIRCSNDLNKIIGKVELKSNLNKFRSGNGELFSIELNDGTGKIRMVFFNQCAQKFFDLIEVSDYRSKR